MKRNLIVLILASVMIGVFVIATRFLTGSVVPPVDGYLEGEHIRFIHTEASDTKIVALLTEMKGSPVLLVPALARAPVELLANVYVFTNGIQGDGPLKFQRDVFDRPPGTAGYSPLRRINLVTWKNPGTARLLKTAATIEAAKAKGEVTIEQPGVVVNMPLLTWPGGHR
ncbi:MAG TPA: hypothetical protein VGA88_06925 [Burkholderiales bacterium]